MKKRLIIVLLSLFFVLFSITNFVVAQSSTYKEISAGGGHTCAIKMDNTVECWGNNSNGQATAPGGTYSKIAAGQTHTCGIQGTGSSGTLTCWGSSVTGFSPSGNYKEVSAGNGTVCAIKADDTIACWGHTGTPHTGDNPYKGISTGSDYSCVLDKDTTGNNMNCWGTNNADDKAVRRTGIFTTVSAGYDFSCATTSTDYVCWGTLPGGVAAPATTTDFLQISIGKSHVCGIKTDNSIACWGDNTNNKATPPSGTNFQKIDAGYNHTCAIKTDGTVVCWGKNDLTLESSLNVITEAATNPSTTVTANLTMPVAASTNITLTLSGSATATSDYTASPAISSGTVTINIPIGGTTGTATFTSVDDNVVEGTPEEAADLTPSAPAGISVPGPLTFKIEDNDTAGITVTESGGDTLVTEGSPTDDYTISLNKTPVGNVVINFTVGAQCTISGSGIASNSVTLSAGTPNVTVTITPVNDDVVEGAHTCAITHAINAGSTDDRWDSVSIAGVTADITDNDNPGITINESGGVQISESGTNDTYTIQLNKLPRSGNQVSIVLDPDGQCRLNGAAAGDPVTLNLNTMTASTVTVAAVDDNIVESGHACVIAQSINAAGTDDLWDSFAIQTPVTASITDNDTAGITFNFDNGLQTSESGLADTYTVTLNKLPRPAQNVVITITPDSQCRINGGAAGAAFNLTLNTTSAVTVNVAAANDEIVEFSTHSCSITQVINPVSTDDLWDAVSVPSPVSVSVTDDDSPSVTVSPTSGSFGEGATFNYTIKLNKLPRPGNFVFIDIIPSDSTCDVGAGLGNTQTISLNTLTATTIGVTTPDDNLVDSTVGRTCHFDHQIAFGTDSLWSPALFIAPVDVTVTEDDVPTIKITQTGGTTQINEASSTPDTYTLQMEKVYSDNSVNFAWVEITPNSQCAVNDGNFFPLPGNTLWVELPSPAAIVQINVTPAFDTVVEGTHTCQISHIIYPFEPWTNPNWLIGTFNPNPLNVTITDDDSPSVTVVPQGSTTINESSTANYLLSLDKQLRAGDQLTITATPDAQCDIGSGAGVARNFTFNTNSPIMVAATAFNDNVVEGTHSCQITHAVNQGGTSNLWDTAPINNTPLNLTILDNDSAVVTVTHSGGNTTVTEGSATADTYTLQINTVPRNSGKVVITVTPTSQCNIGNGAGIADTVELDNTTTQATISVTSVEDNVVEGSHTCAITHTVDTVGTEDLWDAASFTINPLNVMVNDNDTAAVTVTQSSGNTQLTEGSASTDDYTLNLDKMPIGNVVINLTTDAQCTLTVSSNPVSSITLNAGTSTVTVTVAVVDDEVVESSHTCAITHTINAASTDNLWDSVSVAGVTANITDNDTPGITLDNNTLTSTEGTAVVYQIQLVKLPKNNVSISADPSSQCNIGNGAGNPQTVVLNAGTPTLQVTVMPVDDDVVEGPHSCTVTHTINSGQTDSLWQSVSISTFTLNITDNDFPTIDLDLTSGSSPVVEGNSGAVYTYTLTLGSKPQDNVVITVTPDNECSIGAGQGDPLAYTMTQTTFSQVITVTAWDDAVVDGNHSCTITQAVTSTSASDTGWVGTPIDPVTITVNDNDTPGVILTETDGSTEVSEPNSTDTYDIQLAKLPKSNVVINVQSGPECTVSPQALTFGTAFLIPQTVTVTAVDDLSQGNRTCSISHSVDAESSDDAWNGLLISGLSVTVSDNETASVNLIQTDGTTEVIEGTSTDTYTIELVGSINNLVTIIVDPNNQCAVSTDAGGPGPGAPWEIDFLPGTAEKVVTVTPVDDSTPEGQQTCIIKHTVKAGSDEQWLLVTIPDLSATIFEPANPQVSVLVNGDFEAALSPWTVKFATSDKRLCNNTTPVGSSSPCAFRFLGGLGEKAQLLQTRNIAVPSNLDTISFRFDYRTKGGKPSMQVRLMVYYNDGLAPKTIAKSITTASTAYKLYTYPVYKVDRTRGQVTKIRVMFINKVTTKVTTFIDNVDVSYISTVPRDAGFLPLPPAK